MGLSNFFPIIILILNTIPKTINCKLNTMPTKKSSTPPLPEVFKWDSPHFNFNMRCFKRHCKAGISDGLHP